MNMTDAAPPPWLSIMKTLTGTKEVSGSAANPVITGMTEEIARRYPEMQNYCDDPAWDSDETAWCGVCSGYCCAVSGFRPPFKDGSDTDCFGWAQSFASDLNFIELPGPCLGAIMVMTRSGGGHVTMVEEWGDGWVKCRGGNQSNSVTLQEFDTDDVIGYYWPAEAPIPEMPRRNLEQGDTGADVAALQRTLGVYPADGDFGTITDSAVKGYQSACGISVDGEVGPTTWGKLDELDKRVAAGDDGLPPDLVGAIIDVAENSAIARYSWKDDRGVAPLGYTAGVALCFALALERLNLEDDAAYEMARPNEDDEDTDVFSWYEDEFDALGMNNDESAEPADRLRHLYALMLGLGMMESSGRYCEGRDQSVPPGYYGPAGETTEASCWQTSWDIRGCSGNIPPLLTQYWKTPCGFREVFQKGVTLHSNDELTCPGEGQGTQYQWLSKYAPAFHSFVTALGLRSRRQHWGPINKKAAELKREADQMLQAVQALVESGDEPGPDPGPDPDQPRVNITARGKVDIEIIGDVYVTLNGEPFP